MQIGSGSNHLPGCAPAPDGAPPATPVAPAPGMPEPPPPGRSRRMTIRFLIVAGAMVAAVGLFLARGQAGKGGEISAAKDGALRFLTRMAAALPGTGASATNGVAARTPTQQRLAAEYSPIRPINETKRVKELERNRVAGPNPDSATSAVISAAEPVATNVTPPATVVPAPAAAGSGKAKPLRQAGAVLTENKMPDWPAIKVTATIGDQHARWFARVNGHLVTTGDTINGAAVVAISWQSVTMKFNGQQRDFYTSSDH